jgi:murein tripeptide amidase MpaA
MLKIDSDFDGGNIEIVDLRDPLDIRLKIRKDTCSDFLQWFYFCLEGAAGQECRIHILNASETTYAKGWEGYQALASTDGKTWTRIATDYDGKSMILSHHAQAERVFFAYFTPYPLKKHQDLIQLAHQSAYCQVQVLGNSLQGRDMSVLCFGDPVKAQKKVWIIARQHPGETMAEWFVHGLVEKLIDFQPPLLEELLLEICFYIVPNMNPDGSFLGNLRCNAAGINLNREWMKPSMEKSPEVFMVRNRMLETGVDLFLDIHGDEEIPYCFLSGCEGTPAYSSQIRGLETKFKKALVQSNPDFQTIHGYEPDLPGRANLGVAANWIGNQFACLSATIEMPFKDNLQVPDPTYGWSAERSQRLGASTFEVISDFQSF